MMPRMPSRAPSERRPHLPRTFFNITYRAKKKYIPLDKQEDWDEKVEVLPPCGDGRDAHPKPLIPFSIDWGE